MVDRLNLLTLAVYSNIIITRKVDENLSTFLVVFSDDIIYRNEMAAIWNERIPKQ